MAITMGGAVGVLALAVMLHAVPMGQDLKHVVTEGNKVEDSSSQVRTPRDTPPRDRT